MPESHCKVPKSSQGLLALQTTARPHHPSLQARTGAASASACPSCGRSLVPCSACGAGCMARRPRHQPSRFFSVCRCAAAPARCQQLNTHTLHAGTAARGPSPQFTTTSYLSISLYIYLYLSVYPFLWPLQTLTREGGLHAMMLWCVACSETEVALAALHEWGWAPHYLVTKTLHALRGGPH